VTDGSGNGGSSQVEALTASFSEHGVHYGPKDPKTLKLGLALGAAYREDGRFEESNALLQSVVRELRAVCGRRSLEAILGVHELARTYVALGRYPDAKQLQLAAGRALSEDYPDEFLIGLENYRELAETFFLLGDMNGLVRVLEFIVQSRTLFFGPKDPERLTALQRLFWSHLVLGNAEIALETAEAFRADTQSGDRTSRQLLIANLLVVIALAANGQVQAASNPIDQTKREGSRFLQEDPLEVGIHRIGRLLQQMAEEPTRSIVDLMMEHGAELSPVEAAKVFFLA